MTKPKRVKIPKRLQPVLWSVDVTNLDIMRDKGYIVHQVLIYGSFKDLKWLFKTYSRREIIDVFLHVPYKNYPKKAYHFVKNYLLGLKDKVLDKESYVTSILGPVRPRATGRV